MRDPHALIQKNVDSYNVGVLYKLVCKPHSNTTSLEVWYGYHGLQLDTTYPPFNRSHFHLKQTSCFQHVFIMNPPGNSFLYFTIYSSAIIFKVMIPLEFTMIPGFHPSTLPSPQVSRVTAAFEGRYVYQLLKLGVQRCIQCCCFLYHRTIRHTMVLPWFNMD